jgi:DNA-directed RNA polymerase subunit alpha
MHIATNGSISPQEAMNYAISIAMNQFESLAQRESLITFENKLSTIYNTEKNVTKSLEDSWKIPKLKDNFSPELFLKSIDILGLPARAHNCLISAGVERIIDLVNMSEQDIWMLKNFGKKSYDDLAQVMKELGLSFEMNINEKQIIKYMEKQV